MLPASFDDNSAFAVLADSRQGFHFVLASKKMLSEPMPFDPLWVFECGDLPSMNAAGHWLSVRRGLWQEWGKLAEAEGRVALGEHLDDLMAKQPIGVVQASIVRCEADPKVLSLGETVVTPTGLRNEIFYQHRFKTTGQRKRFFEWFRLNSRNGSIELLIKAGLRYGTSEMAMLLDEIANSPAVSSTRRRAA